MIIRPYQPSDRAEWGRMRLALYTDLAAEDAEADMDAWLAQPVAATLVAARPSGGLAGFAEAGIRSYAEGCLTSPVAYLEGWYVDPDMRRQGVGGALIRAVEEWARSRGYRELASDVQLENGTSHAAHRRLGFDEVERLVAYRKSL